MFDAAIFEIWAFEDERNYESRTNLPKSAKPIAETSLTDFQSKFIRIIRPYIEKMSDSEDNQQELSENQNEKQVIPDGIPKSGRVWKKKQTFRTSTL